MKLSTGLAVFGWINAFAMVWALLLGWIDWAWPSGLGMALFLLVAIFASVERSRESRTHRRTYGQVPVGKGRPPLAASLQEDRKHSE